MYALSGALKWNEKAVELLSQGEGWAWEVIKGGLSGASLIRSRNASLSISNDFPTCLCNRPKPSHPPQDRLPPLHPPPSRLYRLVVGLAPSDYVAAGSRLPFDPHFLPRPVLPRARVQLGRAPRE